MSKVIQQTSKSIRGQIENMNRTHGAEMRSIQESFQQRKADLKATNEAAIIDIQNENHKQIDSEQQKKEKVLEGLRKNLDETKQRTEKELAALKTTEEKTTDHVRTKTTHDRQRISQEHESHLEEINDRFNDKAREINYQGQRRLSDIDDIQKENYSRLRDEHTAKVTGQTLEFNKRYSHDEQKYREFKAVQDNTFKKERVQTNQRQQKDLAKMTGEHTAFVQEKDKNFRKGLREQDLFLEKKWQDTMKNHESNFKNLDELHKKVVTKVKTDLTNEVSQVVKRSEDKFYQFSELKPVITQHPDHVEIKVAVPEHSKQDLQLTTNNKEIVLVFNRRYQDTNKTDLGSAKVHRVESFTSRLNVDAHLDPRSVKSTYDGGTMTFTIKKS